ncbi:MAG: cephalosporin hydroxylase family protein [Patescibacteria group bacterium]
MNQTEAFKKEVVDNIKKQGRDAALKALALEFTTRSLLGKYSYNFRWLGRPIIQHPQDVVAIQELIWDIKPDLVIETGIAHGGSLILSASILELIGKGEVLGIDIDIRKHNRREIEKHRMFKRITMLEGSSIDPTIIERVKKLAKGKKKILIFLDSNHAHDHVLRELELYSPLISRGSYIVVFDTIAEDLPKGSIKNRPWDKGSNPKTAVKVFLKIHKDFAVDRAMEDKLLITAAPNGFLRRIK